MADIRTYRNKLNGLVGAFPREFGDIFKDTLEEIEEGASAIASEVAGVPAASNSTEVPSTEDATNEGTAQ